MSQIRTAVPADAAALADLAERSFRATFGAANRADDLDLHCRSSYGTAIQLAEIEDADKLTLLCEIEGRLAGYIQLRWGLAPGCVQARAAGEIQRLYVDAPWHGRGIAQALMAAGLAHLQQRGCDRAWLGVWEHNPRAIAFYQRLGFEVVGDQVFVVGADPQRDLVMARPLAKGE